MRLATLLEGVALGAAAMFFFDPVRGRRRRAELRDKLKSEAHAASDAFRIMRKDLRNRAKGLIRETAGRLHRNGVDDVVLIERIRSSLGRHVDHPGSIEISASSGTIYLRGYVLTDEVDDVMDCARGVSGVRRVVNEMYERDEPGDIPALQGNRNRMVGSQWNPSMSMAMCLLGLGIAANGIRRRDALGSALAVLGSGLVAKGIMDTESRTRPWNVHSGNGKANGIGYETRPTIFQQPVREP